MDEKNIRRFAEDKKDNRNENLSLANKTESALCGQLMLLCTVFLTGAVVTIGNSEILNTVSDVTKFLILIDVAFVFLSIGSGIRYYIVVYNSYIEWAFQSHDDYELLRDLEPDNTTVWNRAAEKLNERRHQQSDRKWLVRQISCIGISAFFFILVIASALFMT